MLRRHALRLLRPHPSSQGHGAFMASQPERLHHAVHDQLHVATGIHDRHSAQRQRGAQARETSTQKPEDDGPILGQSRLLLTQAPQQSSAPMTGGMYGGGMNGLQPQATGYGNMGGFR